MTYIPSLSLRHLFVWGRAPATKNLSMGSLHTVVKWATRWVQMNVRWQCPSCNLLHKGLKDFEQERHVLVNREELVRPETHSKLNPGKRSKSANVGTT